MAPGPQAFYCLWQEEQILEVLFELLDKADICSVRLANSACCNLVTKRLFLRTHLTFTANSFTKAPRIQALARIGHHIQHLTFSFPHSDATFLPPLIHPESGHEISFLYTPYTHMTSSLTRPKYANTELGNVLTQQYPPLFHAATNVPSFINAAKHLPNMRHLTIKCPGQDPRERYRRDIVDYALISLRIALERAPLHKLHKLTLGGVHPSAFNYLRHVPGFGCTPSAGRRWRQIRKLSIGVDTWDFYGPSPGLDHLKIIDDYIRQFSPTLEKLTFTWLGRRGPCPLALSGDPLFAPPRSTKKLFNEVTSPMSPLPPAPPRRSMVFPRLRYLTMRNATMNAPQVSELVRSHQGSVREFDFENVVLINGGSWDDALAPLTDQSSERGSDVWSRHSLGGQSISEGQKVRSNAPVAAAPSSPLISTPRQQQQQQHGDEVELPSPSAAVAAASRELLDLDVEGLENFLGLNSSSSDIKPPPSPPKRRGSAASAASASNLGPPPREEDEADLIDDLASDIAAAREASLTFATKLTKKRVRRHHQRHGTTREDDDTETEERRRRRHRHDHDHDRSRDRSHESSSRHRRHDRSRSKSRSRSRHHHHERHNRSRSTHSSTSSGTSSSSRHRRHHRRHLDKRDEKQRPETPPPPMPEVVLGDDDIRLRESPTQKSPLLKQKNLNISAPVLSREPLPTMLTLKPAVYDPNSNSSSSSSSPPPPPAAPTHSPPPIPTTSSPLSSSSFTSTSSSSPKKQPQQQQHYTSASSPSSTTLVSKQSSSSTLHGSANNDDPDSLLSPVQRNFEQEEAHRRLAEDAAARSSALQKAKEAVMTKLTREFCKMKGPSSSSGSSSGPGGAPFPPTRCAAEVAAASCAATFAAAARGSGGHSGGGLMGFRLREGLFGIGHGHGHGKGGGSGISATPSHVSIDSQSSSALVPLIFSR